MPRDIRASVTDRAIVLASDAAIVSTATLCPGYTFVSFGVGGPTFSPDQHWLLVDVLGPYTPGNVARTHALVDVRTGRLVFATEFARLLGIPDAPDALSWASGERETLRYGDGHTRALVEPPKRPLPERRCG